MLKIYHIFWTYIGNYADKPLAFEAASFSEAIARLIEHTGYNKEFFVKASLHITCEGEYRCYRNNVCIREGLTIIRTKEA